MNLNHQINIALKLLGTALLVVSCGQRPDASSTHSSLDERQDIVIYLSGGYRSCETQDFLSALEPIRSEIRAKGLSSRFVYSCYSQFKDFKFKSSYKGELRSGKIEDVVEEVEKQLADSVDQRLVVIGHSYGGWTGMEVLDRLPQSRSADLLATIDAISPKHCGFGSVASTVAQTSSGLGMGSKGCQQFPPDWPEDRTRHLAGRSNAFWNFYQTADSTIHSGAAIGAENHLIIYRAADDRAGYGNVHRSIDDDPRVWSRIGAHILGPLR